MKCVCWRKDRHTSMDEKRESGTGPHVYSQLIFNKGVKAILRWRKDSAFCQWGWHSHTSHAETKGASAHHSFNPRLEPHEKTHSARNAGLNVT